MSEYRLEMKNVSKSFPGVKALDDVQLKIKPGEVHALLGENGAGKSTLMKCLFGMYQKDSGTILLDGEQMDFKDTKSALEAGISMIHQELFPIPHRPVMENIWINRFPKNGFVINHNKMLQDTEELFKELEININPAKHACELSVSQLQLCEIAKAVSYNSRLIIMDEPTSSLTESETEHLFKIIRKLKLKGCSIVYISHKLDELFDIADYITIMRDGQYIGTWPMNEIDMDTIIRRMVGRTLDQRFPTKEYTPSKEVVLTVKDFTSAVPNSFKKVNFDLKRGEILGIGGLVGAQRTELVETLFGMRPLAEGTIIKDGKELKIDLPSDAIKNKIALLTEERRKNGIIGVLSVLENIVLANQRNYATTALHVLSPKKRLKDAMEMKEQLNVKTPSIQALSGNLSGGNQQKLLIARWLLTEPDILILDEPTRGIDVGSKYEIYLIMNKLAASGKSIIMISSEMPELLGVSDRIMVMCHGHATGFLNSSEFTDIDVMRLATKYED